MIPLSRRLRYCGEARCDNRVHDELNVLFWQQRVWTSDDRASQMTQQFIVDFCWNFTLFILLQLFIQLVPTFTDNTIRYRWVAIISKWKMDCNLLRAIRGFQKASIRLTLQRIAFVVDR